MGDAQNCAERAQDLCRKGLRPPISLGFLVPNFGFGNRSVHDGCDRQKEPNVFLVQVPATVDNDNSWLSAPHGTKINSSDPPLPAVCTAYATPPLLPFFHPINRAGPALATGLHLDRRIDFSAICCRHAATAHRR